VKTKGEYRSMKSFCHGFALLSGFLTVPCCQSQVLSIDGQVSRALSNGQSEIRIPSPQGWNAAPKSLNEAIHLGEVPVVVHVERKVTVPTENNMALRSWYEATVLRTMSAANLPSGQLLPGTSAIPAEFQKVPKDAVLIQTSGGRLVKSGVTLKSSERPAALSVGNTYLLFLHFVRSAADTPPIAQLDMGTDSILQVNGDHLSTLPSRSILSPFMSDVLAKSSASLTKLTHSLGK